MQLIDKDKCLEQIKKITKDIERSNPNIKFTYNKNEKTSRTYTKLDKKHNKYSIEGSTIDMGLYNLYYAVPNAENQIDAKYLVDFTKVIFHETRHAYQTQTLFQNENLDDCSKNMARKYLLLYYFQSYYENPNTPDNYYHSPFEIDAEQHSLLDTVQYFDTHFLDENGNPRYNAKKMLYEMYKNADDDKWYLPKQYRQNGFDNMIRNMETYKKRIIQKTEDFGLPKNINYITDVFLHHPFYQNYRTAFDNATVGTERDHILLQVILREDPAAATIFKCLSSECNTYLNLFERTNQSNPAKVIPSEALHSPHNTQKTSKVLHPTPKMSESDKQRRNIDRITKAEHICRNIDYDDSNAFYNHDDFHV